MEDGNQSSHSNLNPLVELGHVDSLLVGEGEIEGANDLLALMNGVEWCISFTSARRTKKA